MRSTSLLKKALEHHFSQIIVSFVKYHQRSLIDEEASNSDLNINFLFSNIIIYFFFKVRRRKNWGFLGILKNSTISREILNKN